jgi:2-dehydropantoate 2-reductase
MQAAGRRREGMRPSMGQDVVKGRRTEIDYINGLVVSKGRQLGIATPVNEGLVAAVKRVERGEVEPNFENVAAI